MRTTMCVVAALTFAAAVGCGSADEPSTSTGEETSLLEKARHDEGGKKDDDRDDGKKEKGKRVDEAKLDLAFWGKTDKDMKSFWDFAKKKKIDVKDAKRIFFELSKDKKDEFFELSKDKKDDFFDESAEASRRVFDKLDDEKEDFFELSKGEKKDFFELSKDEKEDVFDGKKVDGRMIVWGDGVPEMNMVWGGVPWGDENDGKDEKGHKDGAKDPSDD